MRASECGRRFPGLSAVVVMAQVHSHSLAEILKDSHDVFVYFALRFRVDFPFSYHHLSSMKVQ